MSSKDLIVEAALDWFRDKRPIGWAEAKHIKRENCIVNTKTESERRLALALAGMLFARPAKKVKK